MTLELLYCIGRAVILRAGKAILKCLPLGDALFEMAKDASEEWRRRLRDAKQRQLEMAQLAQMTASQIQAASYEVAVAVTQDPAEREAVAGYLNQLPAQAKRTLSRPEDMSGRTVPAALLFNTPEDLSPFLPLRRSSLKAGLEIQHGGRTWKLVEMLGAGGFGEVWRAELVTPPGGEFALKFCLEQNPKALESLSNEVKLLHLLGTNAKGIVSLRWECLAAPQPFLVYDYVSGGDLVRLIHYWREKPPKEGLVSETLRLLRVLAASLQPAHDHQDGIVHRDLKPANILLEPGDRPKFYRLRISDFGSGGVASAQALRRASTNSQNESISSGLRGAHTPLYASRQQRRGEKPRPADDVYALGIIGYQVLMGDTTIEPPPEGMEAELSKRGVPTNAIEFLGECLAPEVKYRLTSAGDLVRAIDRLTGSTANA